MKKTLNVFTKILLLLCSILLILLLVIVTTIYSCRNIARNHLNEEYVRNIINQINYSEILKEELPIDEIKQELISDNINPDVIDKILEQKVVNDGIDTIINYSIDYVVYGREFDKSIYSEENINKYFDDNIDDVINGVNNLSEKEEITKENKDELTSIVHEHSKDISTEIDAYVSELEDTIKNTNEYKEIEEFQNKMNQLNDILDIIYSKPVTILLLILIIILMLLIAATRRNVINSLSWSGTAFIITGIIFVILNIVIKYGMSEVLTDDIPKYILDLINIVANDIKDSIKIEEIKNIIIGIILITSKIGIKVYKKKLEKI